MEEGGHYYTVYYTSLAVGFTHAVAYRHAVLSQMPDEVSWMDAAHLHIESCKGFREKNFDGVYEIITPEWRYNVEYGQHSLPSKNLNGNTRSSAYQRAQTTKMLDKQGVLSLEFGLLLHRLGDTYAHSQIGQEGTMYTVTTAGTCFRPTNLWNYNTDFGHGHDGHAPDFPFLRKDLFFSYLKNLYDVLYKKATNKGNFGYLRKVKARTFYEVKGDFETMFSQLQNRVNRERETAQDIANQSGESIYIPEAGNNTKANYFIKEIRDAALRIQKIDMYSYEPEKQDAMPLNKFLQNHNELINNKKLGNLEINATKLTNAVFDMVPPVSK